MYVHTCTLGKKAEEKNENILNIRIDICIFIYMYMFAYIHLHLYVCIHTHTCIYEFFYFNCFQILFLITETKKKGNENEKIVNLNGYEGIECNRNGVKLVYLPLGGGSHQDTIPFDGIKFMYPILDDIQKNYMKNIESGNYCVLKNKDIAITKNNFSIGSDELVERSVIEEGSCGPVPAIEMDPILPAVEKDPILPAVKTDSILPAVEKELPLTIVEEEEKNATTSTQNEIWKNLKIQEITVWGGKAYCSMCIYIFLYCM